ncbi:MULTISPECIES: nuclear transport factor 2 family protein [Pseudomonadati]|uniref:DUF4440 domain-containing protein n=1 Tax=Shewanella aestuarii TaxID=1028752 RepID=A0ABT0KXD7_9GAMM|nr:nuclear transport factor 2 family protein [Shewanella aestuarii]MCL1116123.1 DUF4440 domain-containing protein [Shewanella aestuarii]GGN70541.1 hypothetical protein GCM10009193_05600 [Shewanella aestuarii]
MNFLKLSLIPVLFSFLILASASFCFASTQVDNDKLNQNYQLIAQGFEQLNMDAVNNIYVDQAVYISETQDKDIVFGRKNIIDLYQKFFNKIRHKKAKIEIDFRVVMRQLSENQSTDVGYYLVKFHPGEDSGEPISEFAGKFVTVSTRTSDDEWKISVDSNTRSKPEFYYSAKPMPNWYYGRQFIQQITTQSE